MGKRILIIVGFVVIALAGIATIYNMTGNKDTNIKAMAIDSGVKEVKSSVYSYEKDKLSEECLNDDEVFCAIERTVKCTLNPEFSICEKDLVPSFVLGKTQEDVRPSNIRFSITKIKPIPDTRDISVYTKSQCDASWFGLCQGTVIYSLSAKDGGWKVVNVYALEE